MKLENVPATLENAQALREYTDALAARVLALEVVTDALLSTFGNASPAQLAEFQDHLYRLADKKQKEIPENLQREFRGHISNADKRSSQLK